MTGFVYKIIDNNGRVTIPKAMRDEAGINVGDIVKVSVDSGDGSVKVSRFAFIDTDESSAESFAIGIADAIANMSPEKRAELATYIIGKKDGADSRKGGISK